MRSIGCTLWGLAVVSLVATAIESSLVLIAAPLLVFALSYSTLRVCLYRPPEDHLGVVYRLARLSRLVEPDEWVFVLPVIHDIKDPISLHIRRLEVSLSDALTHDQVPVTCDLLVYHRRDLRCANPGFRPQALSLSERDWDSIIKAILRETINEVVGGIPYQRLLTCSGRAHLRRTLSALLAARLRPLGLIVDPQTGVSVQMVKPAEAIWQAKVDRLAAVPLGEAALARVHPVLDELSQRHPEIGWEALLLEWASLIAKDGGSAPQLVMAPGQGSVYGVYPGQFRHDPDGPTAAVETEADLKGESDTNVAQVSARPARGRRPHAA